MKKKSDMSQMAQELDRDLRAIRRILRRPVEQVVARGELTGPQFNAMRLLARSEGMSLKELSAQLGLAHSTVSGVVDRLEKKGMVERKIDDKDQRFSRIVISKVVREYLKNEWPKLEVTPLAEALRKASPKEREAAIVGVGTLRKLLENS
ncbi:MAG: MarR family transcriptional regulator [Terriglobia bacterium]|nr:MarR family transcriptional regulator [Terriglobia bacterium]